MSFEKLPRQGQEFREIRDEEVAKILDAVNYDGLRQVFERLAVRSGIDPETIGFADRDGLHEMSELMYLAGAGAAFSNEHRVIEFGSGAISLASLAERDKAAVVISLLCHEETHASAHHEYAVWRENIYFGMFERSLARSSAGVARKRQESINGFPSERESYFVWFNEGITDELAKHVYGEYLKQNPTKPLKEGKGMEFVSGYPLARLFVRTFCDKIAETAGVPSDVVWGAVVREYMNGSDFSSGEVAEALREVFSPEFIKRLRGIEGVSDIGRIVLVFKEAITRETARKLIESLKGRLSTSLTK